MLRVCIVGVYFGRFPNYFDLWLKSAVKNDTINFIIFTDQTNYKNLSNVSFVYFTLEEMRKLASEKIGLEVNLARPYKCCDFRPAYGVIFEEFLTDFDYWGHCDFDLIWGDIRSFLEKYHLENYEKFLPLGHLSLYKNTFENNRRFMLAGAHASYKTVFTDVHNFAFDETCGVYQIYQKNRFACFDERIFADISKIYHRYRLALNDKNYDYQLFCWNNGHIYRYYLDGDIKKDEFIYIHFKERGVLPFDGDCINAHSFYITYSGFYSCDVSNISVEDFQRYNAFEGMRKEKKELKNYAKQEKKEKIISRLTLLLHRKEKLR